MTAVPARIHECTVSEVFGAGLIQLEIGGMQCVLSPELALEVASSLRRAVDRIRPHPASHQASGAAE